MIRRPPADACRRDSQGRQSMLFAIVILADRTWEQERARVFPRYREG
ncbi:hypothetical protein ACFWM5_09180 [Streptomyces bobili]